MFGWRRKSDGFEWHKYVRTTIKLRRNDRRKKIDQLKHAAADNLKQAGRAGASAGRQGASFLGMASLQGLSTLWLWLKRLPYLTYAFVVSTGRALGRAMLLLWQRSLPLRRFAVQLVWAAGQLILIGFSLLRRPGLAPLFAGAALAATIYGLGRLVYSGWSDEVAFALGIAIILGGLAASAMVDRRPLTRLLPARMLPNMGPLSAMASRIGSTQWARYAGVGVAAVVVVSVAVLGGRALWRTSAPDVVNLGTLSSFITGSTEKVTGRARVLSGDTISVAGTVVRLKSIEAPELSQACRTSQGRAWRCGKAARRRLASLVGRSRVSCEVSKEANQPASTGRCSTEKVADLAQEMVLRGYAFADSGLFGGYGGDEQKARDGKIGMWQGTAVRPSEYRAKLWARAKRHAPDGCPIKGRVVRSGKYYVLPWSPQYRRVRIRSRRGERWFCSETEAITAGWKPANAS